MIAPAVYGGKLRPILASIDRQKLEAFDLAPMDVVRALQKENVFMPAGTSKDAGLEYQIFTNAMPDQVAELNRIPITVRNGTPILVQDVARVRDSSQIQSNIVRVNGREQVYIPIYRQPGAKTIQIVASIKASLAQILARLKEKDPASQDLSLQVVLDQSVYVRSAITGLLLAGLLGTVLSALVIFLFLRDWRSTLVVSLAIPLSILAASIGLFYMHDTFNLMTLAGLATAVGI